MHPVFQLAPIRGITDHLYRKLFTKHFGGFDLAVAPFISSTAQHNFARKMLRGFNPAEDPLPVIPQILSRDPDDFVPLANALFDLGYPETNWNLGCPHPVVTSKNKGSALLRYPDEIDSFLGKAIPLLKGKMSVKLRLGYQSADDIFKIIPILNRYPLSEVIIHARTGKQMYDGIPDRGTFERCIPLISHPVSYNGDINSAGEFHELEQRFPSIHRWMIGRGALMNPFLLCEIAGQTPPSAGARIAALAAFHDDMHAGYAELLSSKAHLLDRMKGNWEYLSFAFPDSRKLFKKIRKIRNAAHYHDEMNRIFNR